MSTPAQYSVAGLVDKGNKWFGCLAEHTAESDAAWAALKKRGYGERDDKTTSGGTAHHATGYGKFQAFLESNQGRAATRPSREKQAGVLSDDEHKLADWTRELHAEIDAILRENEDPPLRGLPTLQDLARENGLATSASDMIAFLSNPDTQTALEPYALTLADVEDGKALLAAWNASRTSLNVTRGGIKGTTEKNIDAREAFVAWLSTWWVIAKVRLAKQPAALQALGVETKALRSKIKHPPKPALTVAGKLAAEHAAAGLIAVAEEAQAEADK